MQRVKRTGDNIQRRRVTWGSRLVASVGLSGLALACAGPRMPPPEEAAAAYARAVEAGDAATLHQMLTSQARENLTQEEVSAELEKNAVEHKVRATEFSGGQTLEINAEATLFLEGGEDVVLSLEAGGFALSSVSVLPARPNSPELAMRQFAMAVAARNYERISGALSAQGQRQLSEVFASLDEELGALDLAVIDVRGDSAVVTFPSGLILLLVRESGIWRIEELR